MSCQSWWCGGQPVPLARVPAATRVMLSCGCAVEPREVAASLDAASDQVPIAFSAVLCEPHQTDRPEALPADTLVQIDLLASLIRPR